MSQLPANDVTLAIWIGVFGKTLVKKGVLTKDEIIAELKTVQLAVKTQSGIVAEIDNMIATVNKW